MICILNQIDDIERNERKGSKFFSKQLLSWFLFMIFLLKEKRLMLKKRTFRVGSKGSFFLPIK